MDEMRVKLCEPPKPLALTIDGYSGHLIFLASYAKQLNFAYGGALEVNYKPTYQQSPCGIFEVEHQTCWRSRVGLRAAAVESCGG